MEYRCEPVKGWEEYQVDTNGVVYGKNGQPLKYSLNHSGYCMINFYVNHVRKGFAIHTLVAKQFLDNDDTFKTQVNHKDGNKTNNRVDNLEWVTPLENTRHAIEVLGHDNSGGNHVNAKRVIGKTSSGTILYDFPSMADAGRYFAGEKYNPRYSQNSICRQIKGRRKSYKGCQWEFVE